MNAPNDAVTADLFGLAAAFPCPGWTLLDSARSHRFTGELTCATIPVTKVYFDAGQIYFAERVSDPSLGARLVDAGALSAAELERGSMFVGGIAHLGRLFDRVGSVDREQVLLVAELMTEDCVAWLASQLVAGVTPAPYRHHPSGVRRWSWPPEPPVPSAVEPFPPPPVDAAPSVESIPDPVPVEPTPPAESFPGPVPAEPTPPPSDLESSIGSDDDDMIRWDQPLWLDRNRDPVVEPLLSPPPPEAVSFPVPPPTPAPIDEPCPPTDEPGPPIGAPPVPTDPGPGAPAVVAAADPVDRFEVIWPSGQVDEQVDEQVELPNLVDHDPTEQAEQAAPQASTLPDVAFAGNSADLTTEHLARRQPQESLAWMAPSTASSESLALAVRRAVATIETGSLEARRRFVAVPSFDDPSRGETLHDTMPLPTSTLRRRTPPRNLFDDLDNAHDTKVTEDAIREDWQVDAVEPAPDGDEDERVGALRRLIDSLRRG